MTEALKAMVEAMAAEFSRQCEEGTQWTDEADGDPTLFGLDGRFDLEKVARAGLAAIRPADALDQTTLLPLGGFPEMALRAAVDAILKETP